MRSFRFESFAAEELSAWTRNICQRLYISPFVTAYHQNGNDDLVLATRWESLLTNMKVQNYEWDADHAPKRKSDAFYAAPHTRRWKTRDAVQLLQEYPDCD